MTSNAIFGVSRHSPDPVPRRTYGYQASSFPARQRLSASNSLDPRTHLYLGAGNCERKLTRLMRNGAPMARKY